MPTTRPRLALLVTTIAAAVPGCDRGSGTPATSPKTPAPVSSTQPAPIPTPAAPRAPASPTDPRAEPYQVTVRHVLYAYKGASRSKVGRTKEQARGLAESAIQDLQKGRSFEEIVPFTDDQKPDGRPNETGGVSGRYVVTRSSGFAAPFVDAAFSTPVGQVAPKPVETEFGYHVIVRVQ